ncbi:hypothetical protein V8F20_000209, partial [Naviculisporaceae sp. PSN 640]
FNYNNVLSTITGKALNKVIKRFRPASIIDIIAEVLYDIDLPTVCFKAYNVIVKAVITIKAYYNCKYDPYFFKIG